MDCRAATLVPIVEAPELPAPDGASARNEAISDVIVVRNELRSTEPVPLGSRLLQIDWAPALRNTAGGFRVWNAWLNWAWSMVPLPQVSMLSNRFDIF